MRQVWKHTDLKNNVLAKQPIILHFYIDGWCATYQVMALRHVNNWSQRQEVTWKCPVGTYLKSPHTHIELVPLFFLLNVWLWWRGLNRQTRRGEKTLKILQLLNLRLKISIGIILMYKKLFMPILDTVAFESHRWLILVPNKSLIMSGIFLGSTPVIIIKQFKRLVFIIIFFR